jgi:hypothetical protein
MEALMQATSAQKLDTLPALVHPLVHGHLNGFGTLMPALGSAVQHCEERTGSIQRSQPSKVSGPKAA